MILNGRLVIIAPNGAVIHANQLPDAPHRRVSKRDAKSAGKSVRHERAKQFKWCMLTGGKNPPIRNQWGIP